MITIKNKIKKLKSLTLRFQINDGEGGGGGGGNKQGVWKFL